MIAAPFYGEFGWEVALWAPFLRARSKHDSVEVICRPGHGFLYEDFALTITEAEPPSGITKVDCQNVWLHGALFKEASMRDFVRKITRIRVSQKHLIEVSAMPVNWDAGPPAIKPLWHKPELLVEAEKEPGWIAIHARKSTQNPERNWSLEKWSELMAALEDSDAIKHVIVVGTKQEAHFVHRDFEDLRGKPLEEVCGALARCQLIVGPSSGPMPLASYCETPNIWWSPNAKDLVRYHSNCWNPAGVSNTRVDNSWDPKPTDVLRAVRELLEGYE